MKNLVLVSIICSVINLVCLQEVTESSGDSLTSARTSLTTDWLQSETVSSGEGPVVSTILDNVDLIDESNNGTDFIDSSLLKNGELSNETETSLSSALPLTTSETTSLFTTITSVQTTTEPSTTSTTTSPTTTTTATTTTTTTPPTTTTVKTTTSPPTTTTLRTTRPTTRPPTTTMSTTTKKTTKSPPQVTVPSIKPSSQVEAPCEFLEENFVCDAAISCFGEGTIDCIITDEELVQDAPAIKSSSATPLEETDDYEEESATIGFFPPELVGRVPPRFSFPWHIKPENSAVSPAASSESTTTVEASSQSSTSMTSTITTTEKAESTLLVTTSVLSTSQANTMSTFLSTPAPQNMASVSPFTDNTTEIIGESSTLSINNVTDSNSTDISHIENGHSGVLVTSSEAVTGQTESDASSTTEPKNVESSSTIGTRRKRDSNRKDSQSSESLKLTVEDSKRRVKSCKVTGNLHCTPTPTTASCRGRGTCKVISVEKTEKSTSSKGVENWAIAVIAICATAAVLTIGLLVYLVVTSWKKLKVQPQNGVTTLNYVNSSPP